jgi:hypothetical protein
MLGQMTPQTPGEKLVQLEARVKFLEAFIPQFSQHMQEIRTFVDDHKATERERAKIQEERHKENSEKLAEIANTIAKRTALSTFVQALIALAALAVTIFFGVVTVKAALRSDFKIQHMFSHTPVLAESEK